MSEWQPIATAPRYAEAILATNANYAYGLNRCVVVFWDEDHENPGWHRPTDEDDAPAMTFLTHWMPLPGYPEGSPFA